MTHSVPFFSSGQINVTHRVQVFLDFFLLLDEISGLVPTGMEALGRCPVIWAPATEDTGGRRMGTGGYRAVHFGTDGM